MEENNRKGTGVFYAVVGVATLVVAIIGATFAYFSASASSNTDITGNTAAAGGLTLAITPVGDTNDNMIPVNFVTGTTDTTDQFADALGATKGAQCKDENSSNVCQVYTIKITNGSSTNQVQVKGTLNLDGAANMKWQLLSSSTATSRADFATVVSEGATGFITVGGNTGGTGTSEASHTLAANASGTYYIVVWLEETGGIQDSDQTSNYTGTVEFNAVDASGNTSGVTASFS